MQVADAFPNVGVPLTAAADEPSSSAGAHPPPKGCARTSSVSSMVQGRSRAPTPTSAPQVLDTQLARQGSNFGLPIALQLATLMGGAVGVHSVREPARVPARVRARGRQVVAAAGGWSAQGIALRWAGS